MLHPPARILYTEDDPDTRELVIIVLTTNGCEVIACENQDHALALAKDESFDLYLIDTWLPGMSGIDLCKRLREFDQKTPILFYSGAAFPEDKNLALACGAQSYVVKPANPDDLMSEVIRLISDGRRSSAKLKQD